jgi:HD-GYP domain-containing protein (c-di-GMP phosphodiesterase class II)
MPSTPTSMGQDAAFAELVRHSGSQFDADVVAALIAVERARPTSLTREAGSGPGGIEIRRDRSTTASAHV